MSRIYLGTSGYVYPHWRPILYEGVPPRRWLERYAEVFSSVELNGTFYRLPAAETVRRWAAATPPGFVFACKGSRFITHNKKLSGAAESVDRFLDRLAHLGEKLGPIVWQLPPQLKREDLPRLAGFLDQLPRALRHVVEFRSAGWYTEAVADLLDCHGVAWCEHDLVDRPPPRETAGFRYVRLHGAAAPYVGRYGRTALAPLAGRLARWRDEGLDAYAYFNNDAHGHALLDAADLADLLGRPLPLPHRA